MKTILPCLLLLVLTSCARRPPTYTSAAEAPPGRTETPTALPTPVPATPAPAPAAIAARNAPERPAAMTNGATTNGAAIVAGTNAPAPPAIGRAAAPGSAQVVPAAGSEIPGGDQILAAGMIDFRNMPLDQVLDVYAELVNRTLLRPAALPAQQITLKTQTQLTKYEAVQARRFQCTMPR